MNILVAGGAGNIGSHTCVALLEAEASKTRRELKRAAKRDLVAMCRDAWRFEKRQ